MSTTIGMGAEKKSAKANDSKLRKENKELSTKLAELEQENKELSTKLAELESGKEITE